MTEGVHPYHAPADDVDLRELVLSLWSYRWFIGLIAALVTAAAIAYTFVAIPQYEARSILRTTRSDFLSLLNQAKLVDISPDEALRRVSASLESYENRAAFFHANKELFEPVLRSDLPPEQAFDKFNEEAFVMLRSDEKESPGLAQYVGLQLRYPKGMDGVKVLNGFIAYCLKLERDNIVADVKAIVATRLRALQWRIDAALIAHDVGKSAEIARLLEDDDVKRARLKDEREALRRELVQRRHNRIKVLDEAIVIAKQLGIEKPTTPTSLGESPAPEAGTIVRTEINNQDVPLYFMGSEALEAERKALADRASDEFSEPRLTAIETELRLLATNRKVEELRNREDERLFVSGIEQMEEEKASLLGIDIAPEMLQLARIDRPATEPRSAVGPGRLLVVFLGMLVGLALGVLSALLLVFLRRD